MRERENYSVVLSLYNQIDIGPSTLPKFGETNARSGASQVRRLIHFKIQRISGQPRSETDRLGTKPKAQNTYYKNAIKESVNSKRLTQANTISICLTISTEMIRNSRTSKFKTLKRICFVPGPLLNKQKIAPRIVRRTVPVVHSMVHELIKKSLFSCPTLHEVGRIVVNIERNLKRMTTMNDYDCCCCEIEIAHLDIQISGYRSQNTDVYA